MIGELVTALVRAAVLRGLADSIALVVSAPPRACRADFELPGPIVLERGDVARLVGSACRCVADPCPCACHRGPGLTHRDVKPSNVRPGLVLCPTCGTEQAPRDGHMAVHFPAREATRPCPGSWPAKVVCR